MFGTKKGKGKKKKALTGMKIWDKLFGSSSKGSSGKSLVTSGKTALASRNKHVTGSATKYSRTKTAKTPKKGGAPKGKK